MTNLVSGSKQKTLSFNNTATIRNSNNSNLADLNSKVQNTSLLTATVSEIRPGGDVILTTNKGLIRSSSKFNLSVGDTVTARVSYMEDGETKAYIVTAPSTDQDTSSETKTTSTSLMRYITGLISGNNTGVQETPAIYAKFSYLSPNRNLLKYGHIQPGNLVKVEILPAKTKKHQLDILSGTVISNNNGVLSINSPIGIINLQTNSDFQPAQKILFKLIDIPTQDKVTSIGTSISSLMNNITSNIDILKRILAETRRIGNADNYKNLLQLLTQQHNSATLAKLFHQTRNIPDSDIARWIEEEIVEPFEASSKGNKLTALSNDLSEIGSTLEQINVAPREIWHSIPIQIEGSDQSTNLKVRIEAKIINFQIELSHQNLGKFILEGTVELREKNRQASNMYINVKHTNNFPQELVDSIASIFANHKINSGIDGGIDFVKLEEI